jgi:DNA modification methylase
MRVERIGDATLYLGDCREIMPTLGRFDALVTDPPYGVNYSRHIKDWKFSKIKGDRSVEPNFISSGDFSDYSYVFTRWDVSSQWETSFKENGWKHKTTIVWDRLSHTTGDLKAYLPTHDFILVFTKQRLILSHPVQDIIRCRRIDNGAIGMAAKEMHKHPTEKPVDLMAAIIGPTKFQSIVDPFMGTGATGSACAKAGRSFTGIEIVPEYFDIACRRIEEAQRQLDLLTVMKRPPISHQIPTKLPLGNHGL